MIKEMIKELNVMVDNSMIRPTIASKAIEYISVDDINEIKDFDSMDVTEAVDYILDIVRYV